MQKNYMVTIEDAFHSIDTNSHVFDPETVHVIESLDHVLAEDIRSPIDMPPFNQSSMDGYAVHMNGSSTYKLIGEIKAGDPGNIYLEPGQAVRIFTGAKVPLTANTVVKQEIVEREKDSINIVEAFKENDNIRLRGEQMKSGSIAIKKGTKINPAAIGFMAMLGITEVTVIKKPSIGLITTGNELVKPGVELPDGQIYESNSVMLEAALCNEGYEVEIASVEDNFERTKSAIQDMIRSHDILLLTGGISVGDYDFVGKALKEIGVKEVFYKVKQKPGKPLFFGTLNNKLVFALPGNPAAALSCFYIYVQRALDNITNNTRSSTSIATLANEYSKRAGLTHFLKGYLEGNTVKVLSDQSSAMLSSFVEANCIIKIDQDIETIQQGSNVEVYKL